MDGNEDSVLFSMASARFDPGAHRVTLQIFAPLAWAAMVDPGKGMDTLCGQRLTCCVYDVQYDESYQIGRITPWMCGCCFVPSCCCDFTMRYHPEADYWDRPSKCCGTQIGFYKLKRVVRVEGGEATRTAHFADLIKSVPPKVIVMARAMPTSTVVPQPS